MLAAAPLLLQVLVGGERGFRGAGGGGVCEWEGLGGVRGGGARTHLCPHLQH